MFDKNEFIACLLAHNVLSFGDFTLKSGRKSPYFFNAGLLSSAKGLSMLAQGYAHVLSDKVVCDTVIFGAAYKGIPFAATTAQALWQHYGYDVAWAYNRKEVKTHGEGGRLVGAKLQGKSVWVVDDVMTAGTAVREVATLLADEGATLAGVLVALDRKEQGQNGHSAMAEIASEFGIPVLSLIDLDDIINHLVLMDDTKTVNAMQNYRKQYGVDQ